MQIALPNLIFGGNLFSPYFQEDDNLNVVSATNELSTGNVSSKSYDEPAWKSELEEIRKRLDSLLTFVYSTSVHNSNSQEHEHNRQLKEEIKELKIQLNSKALQA